MFFLYDIFFILFALIYFPYALLAGKVHRGFLIRLGFLPPRLRDDFATRQNIWFHAVSVGEVMAVVSLIKEVKAVFPQSRVVLSTVTQTGYRVAKERLAKEDIVFYAPFDFSAIVRCLVTLIKPQIYVTAETEIWPNMLVALARVKVPVVLVNGRISDRSFKRYQMAQFLLWPALRAVKVFCMQTPLDASRITALGARASQVRVTGNMKFDFSDEPGGYARGDVGLTPREKLLIAGSTHPGEEKILLDVFCALKKDFPLLRLLLAPRHIERAAEVADDVKAARFVPIFFSRLREGHVPPDGVVILDTIGQLRGLYRLADYVVIGKSLLGHGGQNLVEPAFFGKPVVVGPHMENFKNIMEMFLASQAVIQVDSHVALTQELRTLLSDPARAQEMGERARQVVRQAQGAVAKNLQEIRSHLSPAFR